MNVTRLMLIDQLVESQHYTKKAATQVVDDFVAVILDNMRAGNTVTIPNFGTFDIVFRAERAVKHPLSGDRVGIPAHWVPKFFPAKNMRAQVKLYEDSQKRGLE